MDKNKGVYSFVVDYLLEPFLFGVTLVLVLPHIQYVFNASELSFCKFIGGLWEDMIEFPWVYIPFIALFVWWIIDKNKRRRRDKVAEDTIIDILERTTTALEKATANEGRIIEIIEATNTVLKREREVRAIAHKLWEEEGHLDGRAEEHWAKAEAMVDELHKGDKKR